MFGMFASSEICSITGRHLLFLMAASKSFHAHCGPHCTMQFRNSFRGACYAPVCFPEERSFDHTALLVRCIRAVRLSWCAVAAAAYAQYMT
jgi:hypothetical protein